MHVYVCMYVYVCVSCMHYKCALGQAQTLVQGLLNELSAFCVIYSTFVTHSLCAEDMDANIEPL